MIPARVREIRLRLFHMTQAEFAAVLRLSRQTVASWEIGERPIPEAMGLLVELAAFRQRYRVKWRRRARKAYSKKKGAGAPRRIDGF